MLCNVTSELMEYKWISEVFNTVDAKSKGLLPVTQQRKEALSAIAIGHRSHASTNISRNVGCLLTLNGVYIHVNTLKTV